MLIAIKATNFKLTPSIENWILEKLSSLNKFAEKLDKTGIMKCWVEVGKITKHHKKGPFFRAEADIRVPGYILRAEASEKELKMAIVKIKDELQLQIKEYKEKMSAKQKRGARIGKKMMKLDPAALAEGETDVSIRHPVE